MDQDIWLASCAACVAPTGLPRVFMPTRGLRPGLSCIAPFGAGAGGVREFVIPVVRIFGLHRAQSGLTQICRTKCWAACATRHDEIGWFSETSTSDFRLTGQSLHMDTYSLRCMFIHV